MATIYYKDIGDYLSRHEKLDKLASDKSIKNVDWQIITPNEEGDWINKRNDKFTTFISIAPEKKFDSTSKSFFVTVAIGVATNRDTWSYNFSKAELEKNMKSMIAFYNEQAKAYKEYCKKNGEKCTKIEDFIDTDETKISWTRGLRNDAKRFLQFEFEKDKIILGTYRPFQKMYLYNHREFIESPGIWNKIFPTPQHKNLVICVSGLQERRGFACLIMNCIPDLNNYDGGSQCFPLYYYTENTATSGGFDFGISAGDKYVRHDALSDFILQSARTKYGSNVTKEDIFYYVYGILHSPGYRSTFAADLKKMLPYLPLVKNTDFFWAFVKAGRALAGLHLNYENFSNVEIEAKNLGIEVTGTESNNWTVEKIKFPKKDEKSAIIFNPFIQIKNIPQKTYDYQVNGKSAVEWILERYCVSTDKKSLIKNDCNDWAKESENPRYILDLLLSVIVLSCKTADIVNALPQIDFEEE